MTEILYINQNGSAQDALWRPPAVQESSRGSSPQEHPIDRVARLMEGSGAKIMFQRLSEPDAKELVRALASTSTAAVPQPLPAALVELAERWTALGTDRFLRKFMDDPVRLRILCVALEVKPSSSVSSSLVDRVTEKVTLLALAARRAEAARPSSPTSEASSPGLRVSSAQLAVPTQGSRRSSRGELDAIVREKSKEEKGKEKDKKEKTKRDGDEEAREKKKSPPSSPKRGREPPSPGRARDKERKESKSSNKDSPELKGALTLRASRETLKEPEARTQKERNRSGSRHGESQGKDASRRRSPRSDDERYGGTLSRSSSSNEDEDGGSAGHSSFKSLSSSSADTSTLSSQRRGPRD